MIKWTTILASIAIAGGAVLAPSANAANAQPANVTVVGQAVNRPACTYLDAAHMAALVRAPKGLLKSALHPHATAFTDQGGYFRQCEWTYRSRHGYLSLETGPKARSQFTADTRYTPRLPGGPTKPTKSTWADYALHSITGLWFDHGTYIEVAGPVAINAAGTKLYPKGAAALANALKQVGNRLP